MPDPVITPEPVKDPVSDQLALQNAMTDPAQTSSGPKPPAEPSNEPPVAKTDPAPDATKPAAAEPAKEDPKPDEPKPEDAAPEVPTEYTVYADPEANAIVESLKEYGLSPQDAFEVFGKASESGELADVNVAKLTEKLGATKSQLLIAAVSHYFSKVQTQLSELKSAVFEVTGGEDNFNKIAEWAKAKEGSDKDFAGKLAVYREMLQQGSVQAALAAKELKAAYTADPSNKSLEIKVVSGDSVPAAGDLKPISRVEYFREMEQAQIKRDTAKIAELNARRKLSRT